MAFLDQNGESEFPMSKDKVFEAMCIAIPAIDGLKIESADKLQGRFLVKGGVSLYSWGEHIPIQLIEISENRTRVQITSSPKTGIMFGGAFDMGKNRKNIEDILSYTSKLLSAQVQPAVNSHTLPFVGVQNAEWRNAPAGNFMPFVAQKKDIWYEKTWLVVMLCLFFFPVGLYALWKNSLIATGWKIAVSIFIAVVIFANLNKEDRPVQATEADNREVVAEHSVSKPAEAIPLVSPENEKVEREKEMIIEKLKVKAKSDWPDDYSTQEFWVNEQIDAYEYMLTIEDNSIKAKAQQDWPLDFSTQKFWYNEQIEARERMR